MPRRMLRYIGLNMIGLLLVLLTPYATFGVWIGFACIFYEIYRKPVLWRDVLLGYAFGLIYWSTRVHSVIPAYGWEMFLKMIGLASVPWLILFLGTSAVHIQAPKKMVLLRILTPGILWIAMMRLFHMTPVDSFPLELPFHQPLPFWQLAAFAGIGWLIFVILTLNASLALFLVNRSGTCLKALSISTILGTCIYVGGLLRLQNHPPKEGDIPVAIVQTNLPISVEWRKEHADLILETYASMAHEAAKHHPQMMFFPQYNLSYILNGEETLAFFGDLAKETRSFMAVGTFTDFQSDKNGGESQYNIAYVFSPDGKMIGSYKAMENLPFRNIGEAFGSEQQTVETPAGKAGILLCYEHSLHRLALNWKASGADYIMILTNPSTFASNLIRRSHIQQAQLRAIETRSEIVLATANGPSVVIDSLGRIRATSAYDEKRIVYSSVASH